MASNAPQQHYLEYQADKASAVSETDIPAVPHVVWRRIIHYISDSLDTLLHISAFSTDLQYMCRPYTSSYFHTIFYAPPPLSRDYYYHDLLRLVLDGHLDASAIYEFCYVCQYEVRPTFEPTTTARPGLPGNATEQQVRRFDRLFREAVRASPFIDPNLEPEVCTSFQHGDQDVALAVLLPLCAKLKTLQPPVGLTVCERVFEAIMEEHRQRGTVHDEARLEAKEAAARDLVTEPQARRLPLPDALPFSELLVLNVQAHDLGHSFPLSTLLKFMCIPSLHRICLEGIRDREFSGWPMNGFPCSCPEIYFQQSSATDQAVLAFAQGLEPTDSCRIRQWYQRPRPSVAKVSEDDPTWDTVIVQRRADGSKHTTIGLQDDGGNPGYEYPWVSWLWRGKMQDWTRLDETFELEEGDRDEDFLQGLLV